MVENKVNGSFECVFRDRPSLCGRSLLRNTGVSVPGWIPFSMLLLPSWAGGSVALGLPISLAHSLYWLISFL